MRNTQQKLADPESQLLDYLERLRHHRAGRKVIFTRLSALQENSHDASQVEFVEKLFGPLLRNYGGELFRLQNDDMVAILLMGVDVALVERIVVKLTYLFRDDPFIDGGRGAGAESFCTWFDLESQYADVRAIPQTALQGGSAGPVGRSGRVGDGGLDAVVEDIDGEDRDEPILLEVDASQAEPAVETTLGPLPISAMVNASPIASNPSPGNFTAQMRMIGVRMDAVHQYFMPGIDVEANAPYERAMKRFAERHLLAALPEFLADAFEPQLVAMSLDALLSAEFLLFDRKWEALKAERVTWLIDIAEVQADAQQFRYARDFLKERSFGVGVGRASISSLAALATDPPGVDLLTLEWRAEAIEQLSGMELTALQETVGRIDANKLIVTGLPNRESIEQCRQLGAELLEGAAVAQILGLG